MIEQDIKLLDHCVLDLQHRVRALEAQVKALQRRVITLELQADRKTEPSDSEKPNNCEDCIWTVCNYNKAFKDEPTISKMEQVEDETRLTAKCLNCANGSQYKCSKCDGEMYYKYDKDEPQTDYTPDCPFCKRYGTEDCLGSDCRHYKTYKTELQTKRSE